MTDPLREYSEAIDKLNKAHEKVQAIKGIIGEVHTGLNLPYQFMVSNVRVIFPQEVAMGQLPTLNANKWPSAEQVAEALTNLHVMRKQVDHIWNSLPAADKKIVYPPPEGK